ncbi:HNH endonuclease [Pseudomonas fortuita]|uniref:HNH endonuclease n=1 Tax=Pseudomonas fortuita TaxID=3233375 RepID=UPI003D9FFD64
MSSKSTYDDARPAIPADIRRSIEVESGHCCAIKNCGEHTYLDVHHIDLNRANNKLENLILLCVKHHRMAHADEIDRKSLRQYKELLSNSHVALITSKFEELKALIVQDKSAIPIPEHTPTQPVDAEVEKKAAERSAILHFALYHVAIVHYENEHHLYFEHQVHFKKGATELRLDALRQDDDLDEDIILDVHYLRKSYQDAPIYGHWLSKKIEIYQLLTGRKARGVLIVVVGSEKMLGANYLSLTEQGVADCGGNVELKIYSCAQVGFHPGSVSAAFMSLNIKRDL